MKVNHLVVKILVYPPGKTVNLMKMRESDAGGSTRGSAPAHRALSVSSVSLSIYFQNCLLQFSMQAE